MDFKRRFLNLLLCAAAVVAMIAFQSVVAQAAEIWNGGTEQPAGEGLPTEPYQISTAGELAWFAGQVNGGNGGIYAVLTSDIVLNDTSNWQNWETNAPTNIWTPIGNNTSKYTGSFDGNGFTVSGLYIGGGDRLGLFGYLDADGRIQNVKVIESYVCGTLRIGGICGQNNGGSITGCSNYGTVVGSENFTGGICGENIGTVTGCYNYGLVQGTQSTGGVCGMTVGGGTVSGCGNLGSITGSSNVGGVCGSLSANTEPRAKILDCFNTGTVQGTKSGGICGWDINGNITGCYFLDTSSEKGVGDKYGNMEVDVKSKTSAEFALGEVAYLLGPMFGQLLYTDDAPVIRSYDGSNTVFKLTYLNGSEEHGIQYYNGGCKVSADGIPIPSGDGVYFLGWENLPDTMPDQDVTVTAEFGPPTMPDIMTTSLGNALVGDEYIERIRVEGSLPITYEVTSGILPAGLNLNEDRGEITGTPTTRGTYTFHIQAGNAFGNDTQELSITVDEGPAVTTTSLPFGIVGVAYNVGIEAEGTEPFSYTKISGDLPAGLNLSDEGVISGTPAAEGISTFTVKVENGFGEDTQELSITIKKAEPVIMTVSLPSGSLGTLYDAKIETEGKTPFTFTVSEGNIPAGLILNENTGVISGTPATAGTGTFTVRVSNDAGEDSKEFSIDISDQMLGSGTTNDPYRLCTAEHLIWFAEQVNGGLSIHAILTADIALNDTVGWENWATIPPPNMWTPMGTGPTNRFIGSFDGNNHTISGIYINSSNDHQGLFGYIGPNSTIENVHLVNSYIKGNDYVGGICGFIMNRSTISNCHNAATVTGNGYVGGVCGYVIASNTIQECDNAGMISGAKLTGGIAGYNSGTVNECYNEGTIGSNGNGYGFGGISGSSDGTISNVYNTGTVSASGNNNVGGICGVNSNTTSNVYNTGEISGNNNVGKVCGFNTSTGTLTNCCFLGSSEDKGIGNNLGSGTATYNASAQFASGEAAHLLGASFGQMIGTDDTPVFRTTDGSNAVYKLSYMDGEREHAAQYYNGGDTVSTAGVVPPTAGIFLRWEGVPDVMPANDAVVTAVFAVSVELISAGTDGMAGTDTSTKIDLVFDTAITGLTADDITIIDGTGSAVKGALTGLGTTWSIVLSSVIREGEVSVDVSAPEGYTITGSPKTVMVYKQIPVIDAVISPDAADFDLYNPDDVETTITWNSAQSVTDVVYNSNSLTEDTDYAVNDNVLSIKKEYLTTRPTGSHILTIDFDTGSPAMLTINITDSTPTNNEPTPKDPVPEQTVRSGSAISFTASDIAEDEDGDSLTITEIRTVPAISIAGADLDNGTVTVTGKSEGSTSVTVTVSDGENMVGVTVPITVTANDIAVTGVTLDKDTLSLTEGTRGQLTATVVPADATNKNVTWNSDDTKIATVDGAGKVTAVSEGTVTITVTTADGGYFDTCTVTVTKESVLTYALIINADTGGSITAGSSGDYAAGTVINISAEASSDYSFNKWTSSGSGFFGNESSATTTFTMPAETVTITATFTYNGSDGSHHRRRKNVSTKDYKATVSGTGKTNTSLAVEVSDDDSRAKVDAKTIFDEMVNGATPVIDIPDIPGVSAYTVEMPSTSLTGKQKNMLTVSTKLGSMSLPANMLAGMPEAEGTADITIGEGDKSNLPDEVMEAIGDRPLVQLTLTIDGEQTDWNNPDAPVTVSIPYTPTAEELEDPEHITVWYIDGAGNVAEVPSGRYDPETGMVTFTTTHFSHYAVAYVKKTFDDLDSVPWAKDQIEVLASKGILKGITENQYSPQTDITRADFLYFLVRTLDVKATIDENFQDIDSRGYYYEEIAIAKELGITKGVGNNRFNPDANITRQDMMVLTERALRMLKMIEVQGAASDLKAFSDKSLIASYAVESTAALVEDGLIIGSGDRIDPLGNTTRAEAAVFLYRIYNK